MKPLREVAQHGPESRSAEACFPRVIGSRPKRLAFWRQERIERPATALAHNYRNALQPIVDIRALFAVDLYTHKKVVHERGGFRILKAFVRHDVTPVAGRVTD